jgi:hypothetical protein
MNTIEQIRNRRAIEALRAGVPNRDAVLALGGTQPEIESKFREQLQAIKQSIIDNSQPRGILVKGGFGVGKSHLLEFLSQIALKENFVCSKVVISKETPFYDPVKFFRSAAEAAVVPDRIGDALTEITTKMNTKGQAYANFYQWVNRSQDLNQLFAATLFIFENMPYDAEIINRIIRFWSGDKINISEIKKWLKQCKEGVTYSICKITLKELALQRFKFATRLMIASGYEGWILFIDELELIGRYSQKQRGRSYVQLARWMGRLEGWESIGVSSVCSITDDFTREVLEGRNDLERVPAKLMAGAAEDDLLLATQAERGMRVIEREAIPLLFLDNSLLQTVYTKIKPIYAGAYDWSPPDVSGVEKTSTTTMRHYVKGWITEWDLKRKYPDYKPRIETEDFKPGYEEDKDLEVSPEGAMEE